MTTLDGTTTGSRRMTPPSPQLLWIAAGVVLVAEVIA